MWQFQRVLTLGLVYGLIAAAASAASLNFTVSRSGAKWECKRTDLNKDQPEELKISLDIIGDTAITKASFQLKRNGQTSDLGGSGRSFSTTLKEGDFKLDEELQVLGSIETATETQAVDCGTTKLDLPLPTASTEKVLIDDLPALRFWSSKEGEAAFEQFESDKRLPKRTVFLPHLPSGAAASPFPESIAENTPVQVLVIVPLKKPQAYELERKVCADRVPFRIKGNIEELGVLKG